MSEKIIDLEKLCKVTKLSASSLRTYLGHYSLTEFCRGRSRWVLNEAFIAAFAKYLATRKKAENCFALEKWWKSHNNYLAWKRNKKKESTNG